MQVTRPLTGPAAAAAAESRIASGRVLVSYVRCESCGRSATTLRGETECSECLSRRCEWIGRWRETF